VSKSHVVLRLILKDWWLHSPVIILSIIGGAIALAILRMGGQTPFVLGAVFFFIAMIFCASIVPMSNIVNERKKQTLAFIMSLPISSTQYGGAKLVSTVGMFLIPWLTLFGAALYLIHSRNVLPDGTIPVALILANLPFIGFCLITGAALVGESEAWGQIAAAVVNSSYWLGWYLLASHFPTILRNWESPAPVWSPAAVSILGGEFAAIVLILGLTLFLQSRKQNFI
jgi:ABC-2 type transport system permease protein